LHKQQLKSFEKGRKLILTLKADAAKCHLKTGEIPPVTEGEVIVEGKMMAPEPPVVGEPAITESPQ
jgi:hypothetical protein